jgi:hypothetical protein
VHRQQEILRPAILDSTRTRNGSFQCPLFQRDTPLDIPLEVHRKSATMGANSQRLVVNRRRQREVRVGARGSSGEVLKTNNAFNEGVHIQGETQTCL